MKRILLVLFVLNAVLAAPVQADPPIPLPRVPISGDQDGSEVPLVFQTSKFEQLDNVQVFEVPGLGPVDVTFDFVFREASYNNEFGYYLVDDIAGSIEGLLPGEPGYLTKLLGRARVIFPSGSTAWTPDVTEAFNGRDRIAFFIVQANTLANLRTHNPDNVINGSPIAFFSFEVLNPDGIDHFIGFRNLPDQLTQFGFEDLTGGGDADYDDIVYNVLTALPPAPRVDQRDVVFVRGLGSEGSCDGMNEWVPQYFASPEAHSLFQHSSIGQFLNFSYADGGSYTCPATAGAPPVYLASDTCDGVDTAANELKAMIDERANNKVIIYGHSMGGVVSAYMVALYPDWAREKVAAVLTLDSPVQGMSEIEARLARETFFRACTYDSQADHNSLYQLTENSPIIIKARTAATIVPFYHLDGTKLPDNAALGRERVRLSSGRAFHISALCGNGFAMEPNCQPPLGVEDGHGETQSRRFDEDNTDKGMFFGCAAIASLDCTWISVPLEGSSDNVGLRGIQATVVSHEVPLGTLRMRFTTYFDQPIEMILTAPDGTTYGPNGQGRVAGYSVGDDYEIYEIKEPAAGVWQLSFTVRAAQPLTLLLGTTITEMQPPLQNQPPTARASLPGNLQVGTPVQFSGIQSYDADGLIVQYEWDFENDGLFDFVSDEPLAVHVYDQTVVGTAALRVTDDHGAQDVTYFSVRVGMFIYLPLLER